jgi:hypothetical protein
LRKHVSRTQTKERKKEIERERERGHKKENKLRKI